MRSKWKAFVAGIAALCMALPMVAFSGCGKSDPDTFEVWLSPNSGLLTCYTDLNENPVMQYIEYKFDIDLEFITAVSGSEADQFNILTSGGDTPDVMELSSYTGSVIDLVEDGVAVDLTEYMYPEEGESLFPNYRALMERDGELNSLAQALDGHYYAFYSMEDSDKMPWGGYIYRRDLILKYATAEDSFVLNGETIDPSQWETGEDVIFPSGAKAPDLISDWDWMLAILYRGVEAGELDYCLSLYYPGYIETGDMVSAWGTSAAWYKEEENGKTVVRYGGTSDEFRHYIEKMNEWWEKGYIDEQFTTRTSDMFFDIDTSGYTRGRVGVMYGMNTSLGDMLSGREGAPETIDFRACYMPRLSKDMEPQVFYLDSRVTRSWMVTTTALDKNYEKLFAALDFLYSEEGALMVRAGLNAEQYAELLADGRTFWDAEVDITAEEQAAAGVDTEKAMLSEVGMYYWDESVGKYRFWADINTDLNHTSTEMAASAMSFWGLSASSKIEVLFINEADAEARGEIWAAYSPTGNIDRSMQGKLSSEDNSQYVRNYNGLQELMASEVADFVRGNTPLNDTTWAAFCDEQILEGCNQNTAIMQKVFDALEGR